jgi:hypothetical protein
MYKHLSNGLMYDTTRGLIIRLNPDQPHPQNREQIELTRVRVDRLGDLQEHEIDYLMQESRRLIHQPVKSLEQERWYREQMSDNVRDYRLARLRGEYCDSRYNQKYFETGRLDFWSWMKQHRSREYHSFNGLQYEPKERRKRWVAVRSQASDRVFSWFKN